MPVIEEYSFLRKGFLGCLIHVCFVPIKSLFFKYFQMFFQLDSEMKPTGTKSKVPAVYIDQFNVICQLTDKHSFSAANIYVSNDGSTKSSTAKIYLRYHSSCFDCLLIGTTNRPSCNRVVNIFFYKIFFYDSFVFITSISTLGSFVIL